MADPDPKPGLAVAAGSGVFFLIAIRTGLVITNAGSLSRMLRSGEVSGVGVFLFGCCCWVGWVLSSCFWNRVLRMGNPGLLGCLFAISSVAFLIRRGSSNLTFCPVVTKFGCWFLF